MIKMRLEQLMTYCNSNLIFWVGDLWLPVRPKVPPE